MSSHCHRTIQSSDPATAGSENGFAFIAQHPIYAQAEVSTGAVSTSRTARRMRRPGKRRGRNGRSLMKVARPGFWTTSLWFYLLPLGQQHVFGSWTFWLGCFYVTFPLGLLIYGWNDLVDAETDRLNPRKGNFLFGARPDDAQLAALARAHLPRPTAVRVLLRLAGRPEGARLARRVDAFHGGLQLAAARFQGPPALRRAQPGRLSARVRAQFLAQPRAATPLADVPVRRAVCHALASFRGNHGRGTRPARGTTHDGHDHRRGPGERLSSRRCWRRRARWCSGVSATR